MEKELREGVAPEESGEPEKIPLGQVLLDDIFLLLVLGLGVPLILYTVWSIFDLTNIPPLRP